jgi:hypothetical protein
MHLGLGPEAKLVEDGGDVVLDRANRHGHRGGDRGVRTAFGHQGEHLAFAGREVGHRTPAARPSNHSLDDLGVERRASTRDAAHGIGEEGEVTNPMLEQIADPFGAVADELQRVPRLDVLRQDQNADLRVIGAYLSRGAQPIIGVVGRHLDVCYDRLWLVGSRLAEQVGRVRRDRHDLEAGLLEYGHDPFSGQRLVFPDDYAQRLAIAHISRLSHPAQELAPGAMAS